MSNNEIELFHKEKLTFTEKFYMLMDLLITNQNSSKEECYLDHIVRYMDVDVYY